MAQAGYNSTVNIGGTTTAMTTEATTVLDPPTYTKYQVTNSAKRLLDPNVVPTVYKNGSLVSASLYTVSYLFGTITFTSGNLVTDVITVTGSYLPLVAVANGKAFSYDVKRDQLETSVFGTTNKVKTAGLIGATGSIDFIDTIRDQQGSIAGYDFFELVQNATLIVIDYIPGTSGQRFRALILVATAAQKTQVAGMVEGSMSWELTPGQQGQGGLVGWGTA